MTSDMYERIVTKLESREFQRKVVPPEVKRKVLEAARLSASGRNSQHWRFILIQDRENLERLAEDSTSGSWVAGADFAIIVLTDPKLSFHLLDCGRVVQNMEMAAWSFDVSSRIYTGVSAEAMARDFAIPGGLGVSAVVGFGYPVKRVLGRKSRKPLKEVAYLESYGQPLAS